MTPEAYRKLLDGNIRSKQARRQWMRDYKVAKGCCVCGFNECPSALDFHHRPGETKFFNLHGSEKNYGIEKIKAEIAKCDVICTNHHRMKHCSCGH